MATVIEKRRADGRAYYYLVESARVDGKPRIVSQQYLGSAAEIAEKLAGAQPTAPVRSQHKRFGDLAAAWSVIERIGVVDVIDAVVPRRADATATVGTYLALEATPASIRVRRISSGVQRCTFAVCGTSGTSWGQPRRLPSSVHKIKPGLEVSGQPGEAPTSSRNDTPSHQPPSPRRF